MIIDTGIPLLSPVKKSFICHRGLVTITNVAGQKRLNQAAAQRRRRDCCAQTWLDAERGATLQFCIEYLPPCPGLVSVIPQLS